MKRFWVMVEDGAGPLCLAGLMVVLAIQVGGRALGLGADMTWTDEVARILFVWSVFLSLPLASKRGALVHIKLSEKLWPKKLRPFLARVAGPLWGLACLALAIICLSNLWNHWAYPQLTPVLGLNQNHLMLAAPVAFLMVFCRSLGDFIALMRP